MLNIKQIGLLLVMMPAMLVMSAGCSDTNDGGDGKQSLAVLASETVSSSDTANKILTQGPSGLEFEALIVSQGEENWCSFDQGALSKSGSVGNPIYIYMEPNLTEELRTAEIDVTFANGYNTTLRMTQLAHSTTPDYDRAWGEQPEYREDDGYIYKTYYTTLSRNEYYLGGVVRNYSVCYDTQTRVSQWVAYPVFYGLYEAPSLTRKNAFGYDPNDQLPVIPTREQQDITSGYGAKGYDRGHMLPQATRYNNYATNRMTYYATNMMPQNSTFNQNVWASLEGKVRGWGPRPTSTRYDTLYVVTGASFKNATTINNANGPITVPSHCWKVLLKQTGNKNKQLWELEAGDLKAIGFIFTNEYHDPKTTQPRDGACSVKEVEELSGFTFFHNLDPAVAEAVKNQKNLSDWSGL